MATKRVRQKKPDGLYGDENTFYYGGMSAEASGNDAWNNMVWNNLLYDMDSSTDAFWQGLSDEQRKAILKKYRTDGETKSWDNLFGLLTTDAYSIDTEALLADLQELSAIGDFNLTKPLYSKYVQDSDTIYSTIDQELAKDYDSAYSRIDDAIDSLNIEANQARQSYEDQLNTNADYYNRQASGLLSNQYLANAQTYDALQSDMRKSRQNALEAGASAGIRLAGNVNALLSAQNKQSQTAMDTSNALAEMLLQQRNAAAGIRSDYRNYMSDINSRKTGYDLERTNLDTQRRTERENLYNQRYNTQLNDYNRAISDYDTAKTDWEDKFNRLGGNKLASQYQNYYLNN